MSLQYGGNTHKPPPPSVTPCRRSNDGDPSTYMIAPTLVERTIRALPFPTNRPRSLHHDDVTSRHVMSCHLQGTKRALVVDASRALPPGESVLGVNRRHLTTASGRNDRQKTPLEYFKQDDDISKKTLNEVADVIRNLAFGDERLCRCFGGCLQVLSHHRCSSRTAFQRSHNCRAPKACPNSASVQTSPKTGG